MVCVSSFKSCAAFGKFKTMRGPVIPVFVSAIMIIGPCVLSVELALYPRDDVVDILSQINSKGACWPVFLARIVCGRAPWDFKVRCITSTWRTKDLYSL